MAAKGYTTEVKIEAFLGGIAITSGGADQFILQAEQLIDSITGRNFKADSTASARVFDGNGTQDLMIDDCVAIAKVEVGSNYYGDSFDEIVANDAVGASSDCYHKLPNNAIANGQPINQIHLRSRYFIEGLANQRITAKWGYSASIPADIELAAAIIAGGLYLANRGGGSGAVKSEKIGEYQVSYSDGTWGAFDQAMKILDRYKKYYL